MGRLWVKFPSESMGFVHSQLVAANAIIINYSFYLYKHFRH